MVLLSLCNFLLSCASGELSQHGAKHKEDLSALQKSIAALDREKDALQDEVDQKTEKMFVLQEENAKKVASAALCSHLYLRMNLLLCAFVFIHSDLQKKTSSISSSLKINPRAITFTPLSIKQSKSGHFINLFIF